MCTALEQSRSAATVMAYLVSEAGKSLRDAYDLCKVSSPASCAATWTLLRNGALCCGALLCAGCAAHCVRERWFCPAARCTGAARKRELLS
jgi:hypothetical protein